MMIKHLPNQITLLRLALSGLFFLALNRYRYPGDLSANEWLWVAIVLFILAALTDVLDGYLARRWKVESTFGRVMDPFCDKILVLGAFVYLCGPRFSIDNHATAVVTSITGVYPWMVVLILARELLVTSLRGAVEDSGAAFGANVFGKMKMLLQSIGVPVILFIVWLDPMSPEREGLGLIRDGVVYAIVIVTFLSGVPYVCIAVSTLGGRGHLFPAEEHGGSSNP
jgi:CDP-diacylglycerol--glycerol-3-phosphate 3-phosphatidyltransferase